MQCELHEGHATRISRNETAIAVLDEKFKQIPVQMKSAVIEGITEHSKKNPVPVVHKGFFDAMSKPMIVAWGTAGLTGIYSIIKILDLVAEVIQLKFGVK